MPAYREHMKNLIYTQSSEFYEKRGLKMSRTLLWDDDDDANNPNNSWDGHNKDDHDKDNHIKDNHNKDNQVKDNHNNDNHDKDNHTEDTLNVLLFF